MRKLFVLIFLYSVKSKEAARILAVFPTPSISHQVPFRPLIHELARRGHNVTVLTTDPVYPKGNSPENLTEIDVHDLSYTIWINNFPQLFTPGRNTHFSYQIENLYDLILQIIDRQMKTGKMKNILKGGKIDLLIIESWAVPLLGLSHIFKAPVIQMSSLLPTFGDMRNLGAPNQPLLYPTLDRQKINNITLWNKVTEMYYYFRLEYKLNALEEKINAAMKIIFGSDVPSLSELYNNIDMLFLNAYPIWDTNRPVPPSVVYLGGIHKLPQKEIPTIQALFCGSHIYKKLEHTCFACFHHHWLVLEGSWWWKHAKQDLKTYLDASKHGVIYISFGTNVNPSALPSESIEMLIRVFSRLPYDVLWKWNEDVLPGRTENIRISKWLPQSDLLRHPKIKLFVTQGGLQSTDEAITAGVPLIGIPILGDQWYNVEQYVRHKIGVRLDMETLTDEKFQNAIETVIGDDTYRNNIIKLRSVIWDQPQSPLERAVWWTEHVLRHGGGRHLRSPAANIHWTEYFEIKLLGLVLLSILSICSLLIAIVYYSIRLLSRILFADVKLKSN